VALGRGDRTEFAIEGRSLDEFLAWPVAKTGRKIVYTSADAAREASRRCSRVRRPASA